MNLTAEAASVHHVMHLFHNSTESASVLFKFCLFVFSWISASAGWKKLRVENDSQQRQSEPSLYSQISVDLACLCQPANPEEHCLSAVSQWEVVSVSINIINAELWASSCDHARRCHRRRARQRHGQRVGKKQQWHWWHHTRHWWRHCTQSQLGGHLCYPTCV